MPITHVLVAVLAAFVAGGAVGLAGTLLAQWILRRLDSPSPRQELEAQELDVLRSEVSEMGRHVRNLDARLDFTERLLDGALPLAPRPDPLHDASSTDGPVQDPTFPDPREGGAKPSV